MFSAFTAPADQDYEIITREEGEKVASTSAANSTEKMDTMMMMAGRGLQVKAILLRERAEEEEEGGMKKEIRRFRVEEGGEGFRGRFQSLLSRVHSVFSLDTATQRCILYWKDADGDMVQFSTEEELSYALDVMPDDTFRVFVTIAEDAALESDSSQPMCSERQVTFSVTPEEHPTHPLMATRMGCPPEEHPTHPFMATRMGCPGLHGGHAGGRKCARRNGAGSMKEMARNSEFQEVRLQVPERFRGWVRQYVRAWYNQGPEPAARETAATAAASSTNKPLPECVGGEFPQWLHGFLCRHQPPPQGEETGETTEEREGMGVEEEEGPGEGVLPPVYFRWLQLFLLRFLKKFGRLQTRRSAAASSADLDLEEEEMDDGQRKCHKGRGKHGCHKRKGDKHGAQCASESEDSDMGHKPGKNVPKEFRKYARVTIKQMHKDKGDNSDNKEKATGAGVSPEIQEFVEQILLEWHAKLTNQSPRTVAMEMMGGERTLPAGMEQDHFLWLCRFMARWHRRNAGKCDVMSGWSSGETTSDDTSGEESGAPFMGEMQDFGSWPCSRRDLRAIRKMMKVGGQPGPHPNPHHAHHHAHTHAHAAAVAAAAAAATNTATMMGMMGMMGHPPPPPPPPFFMQGGAFGEMGGPGRFPPGCMPPGFCDPRCGGPRRGRGMWGGGRGGGRGWWGCREQQPQEGACFCDGKRWKDRRGATEGAAGGRAQGKATGGAQRDDAANGVTEDRNRKM